MKTVIRQSYWTLLTICFLCIPVPSIAAEDFGSNLLLQKKAGVSDLDHYLAASELVHFMCSMTYRLSVAQSTNNNLSPEDIARADYGRCIRLNKESLKPVYSKASSQVKNGRAKASLKEHYIQVLTSLDGIAPMANESASQYDLRQNQNKAKLAEIVNRIQVEQ